MEVRAGGERLVDDVGDHQLVVPGQPMADGHHDDHPAHFDRERAEPLLVRRRDEEADLRAVEHRASADREADRLPFQAHARLLEAENLEQRAPAGQRQRVKSDPELHRLSHLF